MQSGACCSFLSELKEKELFVLMGMSYTPEECSGFFAPILGGDRNFKTNVLKLLHNGCSATEIAEHIGMSPRNFARHFLREFGESMRSWTQKDKARRIELKLAIPETTIPDILIRYNFTDMSHFTKFCKSHYGCTPCEFQRRVKPKLPQKP